MKIASASTGWAPRADGGTRPQAQRSRLGRLSVVAGAGRGAVVEAEQTAETVDPPDRPGAVPDARVGVDELTAEALLGTLAVVMAGEPVDEEPQVGLALDRHARPLARPCRALLGAVFAPALLALSAALALASVVLFLAIWHRLWRAIGEPGHLHESAVFGPSGLSLIALAGTGLCFAAAALASGQRWAFAVGVPLVSFATAAAIWLSPLDLLWPRPLASLAGAAGVAVVGGLSSFRVPLALHRAAGWIFVGLRAVTGRRSARTALPSRAVGRALP